MYFLFVKGFADFLDFDKDLPRSVLKAVRRIW